MNKKLMLSLGTLAAVATPVATVISCGDSQEAVKKATKRLSTSNEQTEVETTTYSTKVESVLKNSNYKSEEHFDTSTAGEFVIGESIKHVVNVVDSIDFIQAPDVIAVWEANTTIADKLDFVKDFQKVYANNSDLVTYEFLNNASGDWAIDANGLITKIKANAQTQLKIKVGSAEKTIKIVQRNQIKDQILPHFNEIASDANVTFPSVWGTTTTVTWGNYPEIGNKDALKVNMIDTQESKGGAKAYGYINSLAKMTNKLTFNATANYIAIKVYIPENMLGNNWWFRTYWNVENGTAKPTIVNVDINPSATTITKAGWHIFAREIDHSKFLAPIATLNQIKPIQLNGDKPADSGDIYIAGIYTSDEEITEIA